MSPSNSTSSGAYGFRLHYPDTLDPSNLVDLVPLDASLPEVKVRWRYATTIVDVEEIGDDRVVYGVRGATTFDVRRDPPVVRMDFPAPVPPGALVHPLLTVGMSILARWRGDVTLHAGAFETFQGGWGVIGAREAGKSSILASIGARGFPVVADDLLTIQAGHVWAGPSCVDLRPDTAAHFPEARYMGFVGNRPRHRLTTPRGSARVPLRGFFLLDWHDRSGVSLERVPAAQRLRSLYRQEYIRLVGYSEPRELVPLVALPCWRVSRARDWSATAETVDRVLEIADRPPA